MIVLIIATADFFAQLFFFFFQRTLLQWRSVFWITAAILCISNLLFVLLGSAKVQSWNNPRKRQRANSENSILLVNLLHGGGVP